MRGQGGSSLRRAAWGRMRGGGGDDDSDLLGLSLDERMDGRADKQTAREAKRTDGRKDEEGDVSLGLADGLELSFARAPYSLLSSLPSVVSPVPSLISPLRNNCRGTRRLKAKA